MHRSMTGWALQEIKHMMTCFQVKPAQPACWISFWTDTRPGGAVMGG
jgi:hypothetical protein